MRTHVGFSIMRRKSKYNDKAYGNIQKIRLWEADFSLPCRTRIRAFRNSCKIGGNMKKRILSFALVLIFCFSMIGTADLHDEHSHVHAAGQITSLREIKITDKTIEVQAVTNDYYINLDGIGNGYKASSNKQSYFVSIDNITNTITFSGLEPGEKYMLSLYKVTDTAEEFAEETKTLRTKAAPGDAPAKPETKTYGSTQITIYSKADQEYSLDGGATWQRPSSTSSEMTFSYSTVSYLGQSTPLVAGHTYHIIARYQETNAAMASNTSEALEVTTVPVPTSISFVSISETGFTVSSDVSGYTVEYSIDGGTYSTSGVFTNLTAGQSYTLYARCAKNSEKMSAEGIAATMEVKLPKISMTKSEYVTGTTENTVNFEFLVESGTFELRNLKYSLTVNYTLDSTGASHSVSRSVDKVDKGFKVTIPIEGKIPADAKNPTYSVSFTADIIGTTHTLYSAADVNLVNCTHSWKAATCTEPKTCTKCGATDGDPLGHDYAPATCQKPETCKRDGCGATRGEKIDHIEGADGKCTMCGLNLKCVHNWVAATCTKARTCSKCGSTDGKPLGHIFGKATCTEPQKCQRSGCNATQGTALGHIDANNDKICDRCNKDLTNLVSHTVLHEVCEYCRHCLIKNCEDYIGCNGTAAGCKGSSSGMVKHTQAHSVCKKCGACLRVDCENYQGCTETKCVKYAYGGNVEHTTLHEAIYGKCSRCGSCFNPDCKNYNGCSPTYCRVYDGGGISHTDKHPVCSVCGSCLNTACALYKGCTSTQCNTTTDPSLCNHSWFVTQYEVYPCSEEAKTLYGGFGSGTMKCKKCGLEKVTAIPASDHTYGAREKLANGTWVQKCTMCGRVQVCTDQSCGHNFTMYFKLKVDANTDCTVGGTWTYECSYPGCGYKTTREVVPSAHSYGSGVVTKAATQTEDGIITYTCTVCGKTKTESIPATGGTCVNGHTYGDWELVRSASCTTAGEQKAVCKVCGDVKTQTIPATGHSYGDYVTMKNSTCIEAGYKIRSCSKCGAEDRTTLPYADHKMTVITNKEATCISDGITVQQCSVCNRTIETTTPATGVHSFVDDGENAKKCAACGFRYEMITDGNKKSIKFEQNGVSVTIPGTDVSKYFYIVTEKTAGDYEWFEAWLKYLKDNGDVSSDAGLLKAYLVEVKCSEDKIPLDKEMSVTLTLADENKKTSVKVYTIKGNAPVEITDFTRNGNKITVSGDSLTDSTGDFFVLTAKTAKKSNPAVAIVIGIVAVVAIAGVGGYFLYKKGFFSSDN